MVGSFARALFLVHSECAESQYIASRPFRINAGPVSAGRHLETILSNGLHAACHYEVWNHYQRSSKVQAKLLQNLMQHVPRLASNLR